MTRRVGRPKSISVQAAVQRFLESKSLISTPGHIRTIGSLLDRFVDAYGQRQISTLTVDDMTEYAVRLQRTSVKYGVHSNRPPTEGKLSKSTLDAHHRTLRSFFNWSLKRPELGVKRNLMLDVPRPRIFEHDVRIRFVEWQTYLRLLEATKTLPYLQYLRAAALLYLLPDSGARAEGIVKLRWDDVDMAMRRATVIEKFSKKRYIFFVQETRDQLALWRANMPRSEYVFCSLRGRDAGNQLTTDGLYQIVTNLCERAGLPKDKWIAPHDLRHMYATVSHELGMPRAQIAAIMGHEHESTTARYIHERPEILGDIHDRFSPIRLLVSRPTTPKKERR